MASGILAVLDDIAVLLDDVAVMGKLAVRKTAGILGDDLAVNAEKASGFASPRELPVLWAISKGSFLNKLIILPLAFLLSAFLPSAVIIILLLGGSYLAYEGAEKIADFLFPHPTSATQVEAATKLSDAEILQFEKKRIRAAVLTDFILSVEIVIIALGTVVGQPIIKQILVVSIVAVLATIGVYGIVALIVRMDEVGYKLIAGSEEKSLSNRFGLILVNALPKIIRSFTVIGTIALILVSGGIFVHNVDAFHNFLPGLPSIIAECIMGLVIGFMLFFIVLGLKKAWSLIQPDKAKI